MSLFNLLGGASTRWSFITDDDVPRVVDTLERLCSEWIDAFPGIVEAAQAT
jgi:hypothetical protein